MFLIVQIQQSIELAKALKYRIEFHSLDNQLCQVDFLYEGYTAGLVTYLEGSSRPFVLKEFNSNDDLFKPIRPFLAEIQIVTNSSNVSVEDFISDQDTDIEVRFWFGSGLGIYWTGFVLQDDFSESYENNNHILTITASEAIGSLKDKNLSNNGVEIINPIHPLLYLEYCLQDTSKPLVNYTIINNLYHTSMTNTLPSTCLNQCKIDPRTFEKSPREYDDCYTVIEKINTSFNQTLFQYENKWVILRLEELYTNGNIRGYDKFSGINILFDKRFDIEVGTTSEVKPIQPQMLRFINRKPKETIVKFDFERLEEVIRNSSFSRGALTTTYPTYKEYEIDNWTLYFGNPITKTPVTYANAVRSEIYTSNVGPIVDNYITIPQDNISPPTDDFILGSEPIDVNFGEKARFKVDTKYLYNASTPDKLAYVYLIGNTGINYSLTNLGKWVATTPLLQTVFMNFNNEVLYTEWNTIEIETDPLPDNGVLYVYLVCPGNFFVSGQTRFFKNFEFEILNRLDGSQVGLSAVESKFIKTANIKFNNNYDLYLSDFISESYKGLIYESDGTTPTNFEWYRYRFSGERNSFRKQNAITYWSHDRYDRDKIDATFFGLTWNDSGAVRAIGLLNTIKLVDDVPGKIFYISNMKEIDFAAGTWSCTMEEIWDDARDGAAGTTRSLTISVKPGTYNNVYVIPWLQSTNEDFVVLGNNKISYRGAQPITENITISASGNFASYIGATPVQVQFNVKLNDTIIKTQPFTISGPAPFPFSLNLSPTGTYTINPNDEIEITFGTTEIGKSITSIQFTSGTFNITDYGVPNQLNYDNYIEKYIYK